MHYRRLIPYGLLWLAAASCGHQADRGGQQQTATLSPGRRDTTVYTCPMHPQIRAYAAGQCPLCHMTLVPLAPPAAVQPPDTPGRLTLSAREQLLADIHTDTAYTGRLREERVLTGTILFDPARQSTVSARVGGRIEKMYVREPGQAIHAGQKLYDLYSPELLSAEADYVLAVQQKQPFGAAQLDLGPTLQAMRQKLLRWGLSPSQIERLPREPPNGKVTVYSRASGYIIQQWKEEGDDVQEGEAVLTLAGGSSLWVEAQLYEDDLPLLSAASTIWVELPGTAKRLPGRMAFHDPVNTTDVRVHPIYISIPNPEGRIQPGALAYVHLQAAAPEGGVLIPRSAVTCGAQENVVWVALPGHTFERRAVQLGAEDGHRVQVLRGLQPAERVVTSGTFLLNSAYTLAHGVGVNLSGMQMSDMKMSGRK